MKPTKQISAREAMAIAVYCIVPDAKKLACWQAIGAARRRYHRSISTCHLRSLRRLGFIVTQAPKRRRK